MYLTGLIHRARLFDVATRWFRDWVEPGDGRFVTEVFTYESLISGPTARTFLIDILSAVHDPPFQLRRVRRKESVRDAIVASCRVPPPDMESLFEQYHHLPEEFFPRTPVDLMLATRRDGSLVGMTRIKRVRRIAEKASRRVADRLAGAIYRSARSLAEERARIVGIPLTDLVSSPETMVEEFAAAERIVSQAFRDRELNFEPDDLRIDDVIGFKFTGTLREQARIEDAIAQHPGATIVEREVHRGSYNAVNLLVDLDLPPAATTIDRLRLCDWGFAAGRGIEPRELAEGLPLYVESGARTFRTEIILTTYEELVQSEFGLSIHEERILDQRRSAPYTGRIASNVSFLIEYLLMLALSPTLEVDSLPVKMWGRYLPDSFSMAVWELFGIRPGEVMMNTFLSEPDDRLCA